ncbi:MAG: hypothetical protein M1829_000862 [Trizodia sp. TS-e1964]|nr:MAG: hypothetical protein M1829_000862 [Trizodia sp. TS-e1964]
MGSNVSAKKVFKKLVPSAHVENFVRVAEAVVELGSNHLNNRSFELAGPHFQLREKEEEILDQEPELHALEVEDLGMQRRCRKDFLALPNGLANVGPATTQATAS